MKNKIIIMDMDYTLSIPKHREHLLPYKRDDYVKSSLEKKISLWKDYFEGCENDPPIKAMIALVHLLQNHYDIHIVSARDESARLSTEKWLEQHKIEYSGIHLRQIGDVRPAYSVKLEILKSLENANNEISIIIDDDSRNVIKFEEQNYNVIQPVKS